MEVFKIGFRKFIICIENSGIKDTLILEKVLKDTFPKIKFATIGVTKK